jgi:hypothetical protein
MFSELTIIPVGAGDALSVAEGFTNNNYLKPKDIINLPPPNDYK